MSFGRLGQAVSFAACFLGAALSADAQATWTMTTPVANQDFKETEDVVGTGMAPGPNLTADFIFLAR